MIEDVDQLLSRLGEQLELRNSQEINLVVCGGAALNVTGLVSRTTKDIDVLGQLESRRIVRAQLPQVFWESARALREEFELDENWINEEPSPMVQGGLPEGIEERLLIKVYGSKLKVGFIGRLDQIYFKLWASADRDPASYHVQDLLSLKHTEDELNEAAEWCLTKDPSEGFRKVVVQMLKELGFDEVTGDL